MALCSSVYNLTYVIARGGRKKKAEDMAGDGLYALLCRNVAVLRPLNTIFSRCIHRVVVSIIGDSDTCWQYYYKL